jgi:hypothetical protein
MKTIFSYIHVNYSEYQYFLMLPADEQIQYLFDVYDAEQKKHSGIDLGTFFESVRQTIIEINDTSEFESSDEYDIDGVSERVDVLIDDTNIMVESNSLKALRHVIYKFVESGYILKRDIPLEKTFRKDKMTKYLRIFRIIDRSIDLCFN